MSLKLLLLTGAASLVVFTLPAGAQTEPAEAEAETVREAEQAADEAVAEAREEAAQARADADVDADADAGAGSGATRPVTISDVRTGSRVLDTEGGVVGTVESVDESGAVVSTGRARAKLPFSSFGRNDRGLVISMTRTELEAEVEARTPS